MTHHAILIVQPIIGAGLLRIRQETDHLVLIQIHKTVITIILFLIYIIDTAVTT